MIRRPFKGLFFYEWQIGPFVFQVRHTRHSYMLHLPRVSLWCDRYWRNG